MKFMKVYIVRGDYANMGDGKVLGVFDDPDAAEHHSKGCGSLDCGGNGTVEEREAIYLNDEVFLIERVGPINVMKPSEAKRLHAPKPPKASEPAWAEDVRKLLTVPGDLKARHTLKAISLVREVEHCDLRKAIDLVSEFKERLKNE